MPDPAPGLTQKLEGLARFSAAQRLRQEEDAVRRGQLVNALMDSLGAQAALRRELRDQLYARYLALAPRRAEPPASRTLDRLLVKFGSIGQAVVIARSGLWRGTGRGLHDLRHMAAYARRGANPAVQPLALLDQAWYLEADPKVRTSPLVHYIMSGRYEGRSPHPLVAPSVSESLDPHPLFSLGHYLLQRPSLAETGLDPLVDYLEGGWAHDVSPHPLFDPAWYRAQLPPAEAARPPLVHYLTGGWRRGFKPHPLFDPAWYLAQYPDVAELGAEPLTHFVESGAAEGRSPSPWFDLPHYVAARGEALPEAVNPLVDYLEGGAWAVGEARPGLPTGAYVALHPELVAQGRTPLEHWARLAKPLQP